MRTLRKQLTWATQRHARRGRLGRLVDRYGPTAFRSSPPRSICVDPTFTFSSDAAAHPLVQQLRPHPPGPNVAPDWQISLERNALAVSGNDGRSVTMTDDAPWPVFDPRIASPVFFPQRGSGILTLDQPPSLSSLSALISSARTSERVIVPTERLIDGSLIQTVATLAAAGAPLQVSSPIDPADSPLGPLTTAAVSLPPATSDLEREERSTRIRRSAWIEHGMRAQIDRIADRLETKGTRRPTISVVLATRRPDDVLTAVDQIAAQQHVDMELVVGLHGSGWDGPWHERIRDRWLGPLEILHADEAVSFGTLLTRLGHATQGDLVTKWDDDDWYGPHHLVDVGLAYEYSGAELVGKAAEFVYLTSVDRTIRRFDAGAETYSATLAGGTIATSREWLDDLGWWPSMQAGVDKYLIEATQQAGGRTYRLHGFEYVLRRSQVESEHTWTAPARYFERDAAESRSGLDLRFAGITEP